MREFNVGEGESLHHILVWMNKVNQPAKVVHTFSSFREDLFKNGTMDFILEFTDEFKEMKYLNPMIFQNEGLLVHRKILKKYLDHVQEFWIPVKNLYPIQPKESL